MSTKVILMFPYSGYEAASERGKLFWEMIRCCYKTSGGQCPIVVLNRDTERRGQAQAFLSDKRSETDVEIHRVWSVDTCQMWLAGWGCVIDKYQEGVSRIIQLPGDIDAVTDKKDFFHKLEAFVALDGPWDIVIGDFSTGGRFNAKDLIDRYGTYPLMANWFQEIAQEILRLPLNRPRSEFLNIKTETLNALLEYRKFAYEQTLNMLIHSWDFERKAWKYEILPYVLGELSDDAGFRQYRECLDQIERTERMLKLLWREINQPVGQSEQEFEFIEEYHTLDRRSTSIRENARIIIRNLLGVGLS